MICINNIATPRNISTALMYSFAQRPDTTVLDEPYYAAYLRLSGVDHPGRGEIMKSQPLESNEVTRKIAGSLSPVIYLKNMAHHVRYVPLQSITEWRQVFLIRDPLLLIASFAKVIRQPTMEDIGSADQVAQFRYFAQKGQHPIVLDAGELLKKPEKVLRELCTLLEIPFYPQMLSWEAGPRPEDGTWAKYWYKSVHKSTGFAAPSAEKPELPAHCKALYDEALPNYEFLFSHAIKA